MRFFFTKPKILFIGFGNMAKAIAANLAKNYQINALVKSPREGKSEVNFFTNPAEIPKCEIVILAVKPQIFKDYSKEDLKKIISKNSIVISIMAGISTDFIYEKTGSDLVVRTMPNMPIKIAFGVIGIYAEKTFLEKQKPVIEKIFGGKNNQIIYLNTEDDINKITAISGSGSAYFFLLAAKIIQQNKASAQEIFTMMQGDIDFENYHSSKNFSGSLHKIILQISDKKTLQDFVNSFAAAIYNKALQMGFTKKDAKKIVTTTMQGAANYAIKSQKDAMILVDEVTSKGGTTHAARAVLEDGEIAEDQTLTTTIYAAIDAAFMKAKTLG